ncbi:methionine adenosyltransferase [Desulfobacca acetoxidans]|uniref:Methionine adenosyltransferase n=1 Tax=Desulfobacca acetoxidans (strain ATCC 700848 / DSM 11109 / ASRB2) TaxID=880072 RepID=F2NEB1_DESAR|nr:methionine adenosyltransferase [Desulfobacca acetoxidans]AEB08101.1 S-adenosylmethionine synthetase [Desulfobacca acetoxidans DSM 11109]
MKKDFMFTSMSVTEGHPDKLCDQISDAIVDAYLEQDTYARIRAECAVSTSILFISARFSSTAKVDIPYVARKVINQIGYVEHDFDAKSCSVLTSLQEFPPDELTIFKEQKLSEEELENLPGRHQVTVFGFACDHTPALMPLPIWLAHKLAKRIIKAKRHKDIPYLSPDAATQVGVEFRNRRPFRIHSITIIASQNRPVTIPAARLAADIKERVLLPAFADEEIKPDDQTIIYINPVDHIMVGGPAVHSGLTGRKNAIDTYGEYSRHSGAALSGKDPLRIDRVGAYAARYAAKNVVAAGLAAECEVQLSYSIGRSRPVSIQVETFGSGKIADSKIAALLEQYCEFRLAGILRNFNLRFLPALTKNGFYRKLAAYGHVGRLDLELPWEATDKKELFSNP